MNRRFFDLLILLAALCFVLPLCSVLIGSLTDNGTFSFSEYIDLLLWGSRFLRLYLNSAVISVLSALGGILVACVLGFTFAKVKSRILNGFFILVMVLMLMPYQVTSLPLYIVSKWLHIYDTYWAVILPAWFSAFGIFLMRQFFVSVPNEVIEAASLETSSPVTLLRHIAIPMVRSGIAVLALLCFAESWNAVDLPLILIQNERLRPLSLILGDVVNGEKDSSFAGAVLYIIPILLLYFTVDTSSVMGIGSLGKGGRA